MHRIPLRPLRACPPGLMIAAACALIAGCAPTRPSLGDISLRAYQRAGDSPVTFGVQEGRILSGGVDLAVDPDGCVRGEYAVGSMVALCPREVPGDPQNPGGIMQRWAGTGGDFVTELSADGKSLRTDGFLRRSATSTTQMATTLLLGQGKEWDEMRKHPALLAIAAAIAGVRGEPTTYQKQAGEDLTR